MSNIVGTASVVGDRLRGERRRLGLNQSEMGEKGGVSRNSQVAYESGKTPFNSEYLSAILEQGVDIAYVLTGRRTQLLLDDEASELLGHFAAMSPDNRKALLQVAGSMAPPASRPPTLHSPVVSYAGPPDDDS